LIDLFISTDLNNADKMDPKNPLILCSRAVTKRLIGDLSGALKGKMEWNESS
jgi:hypothetical protein